MYTRLLFLAVSFILCNQISAQQYFTLTGQVRSVNQELVSAGDVLLMDESGATALHRTNILNGVFTFSNIAAGLYRIKIVSQGYSEKMQLIELSKDLQIELSLDFDPQVLSAVTVTGKKPAFTYRNGNIIANMESPLFSSVADPVNLLSKIPNVLLSNNGETISVVGKGQPLIYINNQLSTLNDVKSLVVADIHSIELVNNPSSGYEASGRAVLIIRTKNNGSEGVKAELNQTAAMRKYYLNRASANVSYRKKKMEWKANIQFNNLKTWEGNTFDFRIPSRGIFSGYNVTAVTTRSPQIIAGAGMFYQFNEQDYLSINANGRSATEKFPIYTDSYLKSSNSDERVSTSNFNRQPERYLTSNINFNKAFKKANANLFAGIQLTRFREDTRSDVFNRFNGNGNQLSQQRRQNTQIDVRGGRIDFEKNWKNNTKWESGVSYSIAGSEGISLINSYEPAANINTVYHYSEYNSAVYTQLSGSRKKISWSAGIRMEDTGVDGQFSENAAEANIKKNNTNLFPKVSLTYAPDSSSTLTIRYNKNINRPNYSNANQTVVYINPYFEWSNNINLDPSLFQEIAATFQFRKYNMNAGYYENRGAVNSNFLFDEQRGVLRRTEINFDKEWGVFFSGTWPFKYKSWSSTNVANFIYNVISDPSAVSVRARPFLYFNTTNEISLPNNFIVTASGWAVTKSYQGVFERNALFAVDTSITKKMGNFSCTFRIDDVFASVNAREKFTVNDVAADGLFYDNGRELSLSLRYSFGKLKKSAFRNREVDDNNKRVR